MNQRIRELEKQCWSHYVNGVLIDGHLHFDVEKFAELIVQECIGVIDGGRFLHDQAPTALFAKECSSAIKRHFGVKE
jgi:hypothetical protein